MVPAPLAKLGVQVAFTVLMPLLLPAPLAEVGILAALAVLVPLLLPAPLAELGVLVASAVLMPLALCISLDLEPLEGAAAVLDCCIIFYNDALILTGTNVSVAIYPILMPGANRCTAGGANKAYMTAHRRRCTQDFSCQLAAPVQR